MTVDDVTAEVAEHYTQYPFPLPDSASPSRGTAEYLQEFVRFHGLNPSGWRILDAGCGSGNKLLGVAESFPEAHITGIDLAAGAAGLTQQRITAAGLTNATALQGDLKTAKLDGPFDLIYAVGVLHHIADPLPALTNLRSALAETGLLMVWLYDTAGQSSALLERELVLTLGADLPREQRLDLAKRVGTTLNQDRYGECYDFEPVSAASYDAFVADALITPYVRTYRLQEMIDLLRVGGLRHVELAGLSVPDRKLMWFEAEGINDYPAFDIGEYTDDDEGVISLYRALPLHMRWQAAELLARPTGLMLLAWAPAAYNRLSTEQQRRILTLDAL